MTQIKNIFADFVKMIITFIKPSSFYLRYGVHMKAKIEIAIGLATATLCFWGILITGYEYEDFTGVVIGVSALTLLLGLYIVALTNKKQKMAWAVLSTWIILWVVVFLRVGFNVNKRTLSNTNLFMMTIFTWPYHVWENCFGGSKFTVFLMSNAGYICSFIFISSLLCIGALGLRQHKAHEAEKEKEQKE